MTTKKEKLKLKEIVKDLHNIGWGYRRISKYLNEVYNFKISHVGIKLWCEQMKLKPHPTKKNNLKAEYEKIKTLNRKLELENLEIRLENERLLSKIELLEADNKYLKEIVKIYRRQKP